MKNKITKVLFWFLVCCIYLLSVILYELAKWGDARFDVSFEEILFTISSPLVGSDVSFFEEAVNYIWSDIFFALDVILVGCFVAWILRKFIIIIHGKIAKLNFKFDLYNLYKWGCFLVSVILLIHSIEFGMESLGMKEYIINKLDKTYIYEDYYVNPNDVELSSPDEKKNIIYIYLESMENTYASVEEGGVQKTNYIPNLTQLAKDNISFSANGKLGGSIATAGTTWTMGAIFGTTTGIPFSFSVNGNSMNRFEKFAPGVVALGDILDIAGYEQYFLCGSDGDFAGRKTFFEQHGNYEVLDYYYAIEEGYIGEDYYVWWGYEDQILYDIAKEELLKISTQEEPFNFTMLTVDTHHTDGYVCSQCPNTYDNQLANVLSCADAQLYNFINWCKEQDFYDNTVIVITGDHPRMDTTLVSEANARRQYNCIINCEKMPIQDMKHRTFTTMDLFPTVLSAMGFEIPGNRLGLGTDLFSDQKTLAEELGYEYLDNELLKYSDYYVETFQ